MFLRLFAEEGDIQDCAGEPWVLVVSDEKISQNFPSNRSFEGLVPRPGAPAAPGQIRKPWALTHT